MFLTCKKAIQFFFHLYHLSKRWCQTYKKLQKSYKILKKNQKNWFGDTFYKRSGKGVKGEKKLNYFFPRSEFV